MNNRITRQRKSHRPYSGFLIVPFYVLFLFVSVQFSQQVLLEAQYNGVGMVAPQGKRLYLRVFENGDYEFEDQVVGQTSSKFEIKRETLSRSELKKFSNFLNNPSVADLPEEIPPPSDPLDHVIEIKLKIHRQDGVQNLIVTNFSANKARTDNFYPKSLLELFRKIEKLRKGASFAIAPTFR